MTALPTRLLASLASAVPLSDAQLDKVFCKRCSYSPCKCDDSNQKRAREADERMRWEAEMAASDLDIQRVIDDWRDKP